MKEKIVEKDDELDKPFDYGKVDAKTELKAAFFGEEDEMIINYLKKNNHLKITLAHLILYFCYRYGFISERRLQRRLSHLIKSDFITVNKEQGLTYYKVK